MGEFDGNYVFKAGDTDRPMGLTSNILSLYDLKA